MKEVYNYQANEEIKHIVIGIKDLHCRKRLDDTARFRDSAIDYKEMQKENAKHELLDSIKDFILVRDIADGFQIEAILYLPYVRDSRITELELQIYYLERSEKRKAEANTKYLAEIRLLERPWWKKLFKR